MKFVIQAMVIWLVTTGLLATGLTGIQKRGTFQTGVFDESAAEIGAYDPQTKRLFVVNGDSGAIDVLDISNPDAMTLLFSIDVTAYGKGANSVAASNGVIAVAVEATNKQQPGQAVFFNTDGNFLSAVTVGALPDMLTFTPDGTKVLVANEGEPNDDYNVDPEGSVSIINVAGGAGNVTQANVTQVGFTQFNGATLSESIRIFGPGASVAQDLEPEYIAVTPDSETAYVVCQENNALAVIDIATGQVSALVGLGFKDHSLAGNGLDASDRDDQINIANWPVFGMFQPDAINAFSWNGTTYLITANEGDSRDYDGFSEEDRVKDLDLDATVFPNAAALQENEAIGRLTITTANGNDDADPEFERIFAFGTRSYSVWSTSGTLLYDSGDLIEQTVAAREAADFNSNNDENDSFDKRSDNKGPEPEGVVVGTVANNPYGFIGLERQGGFMVVDLSTPNQPVLLDFINNRDFAGDPEMDTAGDLGPEGLTFIPASQSPTYQPLLAVMNEVSGSTTLYEIQDDCAEPVLLNIAPIGQSGIQVGGTPDCVYLLSITDGNGVTQEIPVTIGRDGTGFADVAIGTDFLIALGQVGASAPSVTAATVPTLGTWALIALSAILALGALVMNRRQSLQSYAD